MASKGRIDEPNRMSVYKRTSFHTRLKKRLINAEERARMMGFPQHYFQPPLHELFSALAVAFTYNNQHLDHYIGVVPEKFFCFQGEDIAVRHRQEDSGGGGCGIAVKINPPSLPPYDIQVGIETASRRGTFLPLSLYTHLPLTTSFYSIPLMHLYCSITLCPLLISQPKEVQSLL
jgi:hypothetical protein